MAHVTFIHGIGNKLDRTRLERAWLDALRDGGGPDLGSENVTTSMCYWADVLYPAPLAPTAVATEAGEQAEVMAAHDVGQAWYLELPAGEQRQVREMAAEVGAIQWLIDPEEDAEAGHTGSATEATSAIEGASTMSEISAAAAVEFERIPLPGPLKQRLMKAFLRDVHHYLWDVEFSPRDGEKYHVRQEVRRRTLDALAMGRAATPPHVVLAHSLGSVIAYDVLQNVAGAPVVDGLITVGSPLGLDEVQDRLKPGWSRWDGFPAGSLAGRWINVFDRLDPVCGFDPDLRNDFRRGGHGVLTDIDEPNWGSWRHAIVKYLSGTRLRVALIELLDIA
jgi:hypothetical protein